MKKKEIKKRYWSFVAYPESLPSDWLEILQLQGVACAISPLHNKDINPTGEIKKEHYHIILVYPGPTTYNNVLSLTQLLNATIPISLESVRGMYRYLTHRDNPEKAQYEEKDIIKLNGFDYDVYITTSEILEIKKEIIDIIDNCCVLEYFDLVNLINKQFPHYREVVFNNTVFWNIYLTSKRNIIRDKIKNSMTKS